MGGTGVFANVEVAGSRGVISGKGIEGRIIFSKVMSKVSCGGS